MSIERIKEEINQMNPDGLRQLSAYLLQVRRAQHSERKEQITDLLDSSRSKWLSLDELERQISD